MRKLRYSLLLAGNVLIAGSLAGQEQKPKAEIKQTQAEENRRDQRQSAIDRMKARRDRTRNSGIDASLEELADKRQIREFHNVLDDLLTEFAYDVKSGQLGSLKNLSIRRVRVSNTLPKSYRSYLELLIAERIREHSRIKLISCLPCRTKQSRIIDDKLVITSPITSVEEMSQAASQLGIDYFMDAMLIYHTTHMVLAFQVFETQTKEMVWARTYNSEMIRSRYQSLAIDFKQIQQAEKSDEYEPEYRYLLGIGGARIPNIRQGVKESSMISAHFRGTEKFNNRLTEFGLLLSVNMATTALLQEYPGSTGTDGSSDPTSTETASPEPFTMALGIYGLYAHNFLGVVESYDRIRQGMHLAVGAHLASGYLAPAVRGGWDLFFGRSFAVSVGAVYVSSANILVNNKFVKTSGGVGGDLVLSYNL